MRARTRVFVGLFLAVVLAPAFAQAPKWVLYTHPDKLMSVRFPQKPTESEQETPSAIGPIKFKLAMYSDGDYTYVATAVVYPVKSEFDVKKALDGGRDQALANIKGKAISEKSIKLDGFVGREMTFEAEGTGSPRVRGVVRMFASAKPPSVFMASAMRMSEKPDRDAPRFLDSIHLGKKVETR
ncbi:MAG TPA: hypothetical protein VGD37_02450 [Kofleriaceae bacterium]